MRYSTHDAYFMRTMLSVSILCITKTVFLGLSLCRCPHLAAGKEATHVFVVGVGGHPREGAHREYLPGCVAREAKPLPLTRVAVVGAHQQRRVRSSATSSPSTSVGSFSSVGIASSRVPKRAMSMAPERV